MVVGEEKLRGGRYQRLFHGLHLSADVVATPALRAQGMLKICPPGSQASHVTAAELWDGIVPSQPLTDVSCPSQVGELSAVVLTVIG